MSIWGRIIGGTAGFALGGPLGGILGVIAGSAFDKRRRSSFNFTHITQDQKQQIFTLGIITLSAKLAKSDGQVTSDEINAFKDKFRIPKKEIPKISKIFNEAKKNVYGFKQIADQVGIIFADNKILLEELLNNLFYIAASDGNVSLNEVEMIKSISQSFKFSEKDFQRIFQTNINNKQADPYKILGVTRDDDDNIIRKKWIELNKEHHPDNLMAKGMPKEFINRANDELASINLAYDKIKEMRENI